MEEKRIAGIVISLLLLTVTSNFASFIVTASPRPAFYVDPSGVIDQNLTPGSSFTVSVHVSGAVDLKCWQVCMVWDTGELNAMDVVFGDFLAGQPLGTITMYLTENEEGYLACGEVTVGHYGGFDGDGWLCSVIFSVEDFGETIIDISSRYWSDLALTYYINSEEVVIGDDPRELVKQNGYFCNLGAAIEELKAEIQVQSSQGEIDNHHNLVNRLITKLNVAQKLIDKRKADKAIMVLEDFVMQTQELSGTHITAEAADILVQSAEYIMSHI